MYVYHMCPQRLKRVLGPLELVLRMVVGHHVDAGVGTGPLCKSSAYTEKQSCLHTYMPVVLKPKTDKNFEGSVEGL